VPVPDRIGRYRVQRELGRGGMGVVYAAFDAELKRPVAIKVVAAGQDDAERRKRFLREARAAARVRHPNVCHLYEVSGDADEPFIVMELLEGESLAARLERGPVSPAVAVHVTEQILSALGAMHQEQLVHRDLKPSNIFLTAQGAKLLDFGLAKETRIAAEGSSATTESALTRAGTIVGTPAYMAPEQLHGQRADPRTDLFAAGAVLFEMLSGRRAFAGRTPLEIYHRTLYEQPPALSGSPAVNALDLVIRRALAKRPQDRFPSAREMVEALVPAKTAGDAGEQTRAHSVTRLIALPFRMLRPDPETEFLAFAVPDSIASALTGMEALVVRSSAVAARYAAEPLDLKRIADETDVDVVLTGTLMRDGDQIRASVQLLRAEDASVLWSHAPQVGMRGVFELQDQIVERIVRSLSLSLTAREHQRLRNDIPATPTAFELFLRGNQLLAPQGLGSVGAQKVARELYTHAVEEDPRYAPAWARLGRCHWLIGKGGEDRLENVARAEDCFKRALELSPELPLAHNLYAMLEIDEGRALHAMVRLLERARSGGVQPELFAALVQACRYCGLMEASIAAHERAMALDRHVVTSVYQTYWRMGDEERALAMLKGLQLMDVLIFIQRGRNDEALRLIRERQNKDLPEMMRKVMIAAEALVDGRREACLDAAQWWFDNLQDPEALFFMARIVAAAGAAPLALAQIARAVDKGYVPYYAVVLERDSWLDSLRSTDEFRALAQRVEARYQESRAAFQAAGGEQLLRVELRA
jgi:non-specific serine/threonine protein kinase